MKEWKVDEIADAGVEPPGNGQKIIFLPVRLVIILAASVFIIESGVMLLLLMLPAMHPTAKLLVDSSLLTLFLSPIVYRYMFKPLMHLVKDYRKKQLELNAGQELLKQMVAERTKDLAHTVQGLALEVAERRQAEVALRESEERFRQLFTQSEQAVVLLTSGGEVTYVNPAAELLFRRSRDELLSCGIFGLFNEESSGKLTSAFETMKAHGESSGIERLMVREGDGAGRIFSQWGQLIHLQGEDVICMHFRDITRQVRLEEEAQEIRGRLIHANRMTSLGLLVASVAHEINNPNNTILLNAGLMKQMWPDILHVLQERFELDGDFALGKTTYSRGAGFLPGVADGVYGGARRIERIVENLKDFGRERTADPDRTADLNSVITLCADLLNHHISRTTNRFRLALSEGLPEVRGDARQLEQVAINLIMNALQALPGPESAVVISTGTDAGGDVVLTVSDEGCGIPAQLTSRVLEPFFSTRHDRGGTGLGLSISAAIVKDLGGALRFTSQPGCGTVFTVSLQPAPSLDAGEKEVSRAR